MAIRVGVVGGGIFGEMHLQTFSQMQRDGRCEFVALADLNEELLRKRADAYGMKTYRSHREMLATEKLDIVTVATPDSTHLSIALDAIEAGCHVLVEKPMDVTVDGCHKLIERAREKGVLLQVDFHKRFDPYHMALRDAVAKGRIGRPLYGYAWMEDRIEVPRDWFPGWAPSSSPAWFLGCHMVDLFRWILGGAKARRVYATGVKSKLVSLGIDTFDCIQAKIDFDSEVALNLDTSWVLPEGFEAVVNQGIRLVGTEGIVEIDSQHRGAEACFKSGTQETLNLGFKLLDADKWGRPRYEGYGYASIADVVENVEFIQAGGEISALNGRFAGGEDGLENTRILCAVHESIATGSVVQL